MHNLALHYYTNILTNTKSYMSAYVLLDPLNELGEGKMRGIAEHPTGFPHILSQNTKIPRMINLALLYRHHCTNCAAYQSKLWRVERVIILFCYFNCNSSIYIYVFIIFVTFIIIILSLPFYHSNIRLYNYNFTIQIFQFLLQNFTILTYTL